MTLVSTKITQKIEELIAPIVTAMGYVLWGCEFHSSGKHTLVRVYIDAAAASGKSGVDLDDCSKVSNQISAILDVADLITHSYSLEVSSPGMDRALFKLEHYKQYIGNLVRINLSLALDGRRHFTGYIQNVNDDKISILVDNVSYVIPFANIAKANLVPNF